MVTEKRLKEVEESVRAIAKYVKQQNTQMEKRLNTRVPAQDGDELLMPKGMPEEIKELRKRLDSLSTEKHTPLTKLRSIDDFEERVNSRMDKLEEVAGSANVDDMREKVKGIDRKLDQALGMKNQIDEVENAIRGMKELEKRLSKMEQDDPTRLRSEFSNVVKNIDARLRAADERIVRRDTEEFKKIYDDFGKQFHKENESVKKILGDFEKRVKTLEALLERKGREEIEEADSDILSDIQKILKR